LRPHYLHPHPYLAAPIAARGEMELAYQGEISTPSRCGRMDQCVAFGSTPVRMTFDGDIVGAVPLHVTRPIHMLLVDLGAGKDTTAILQGLGRSFPFPESQTDRNLQKLLGSYNETTLGKAQDMLRVGDGEALGALMVEAQKAFDMWATPACPEQLTAPWLHKVGCVCLFVCVFVLQVGGRLSSLHEDPAAACVSACLSFTRARPA
jgi:galactokinase